MEALDLQVTPDGAGLFRAACGGHGLDGLPVSAAVAVRRCAPTSQGWPHRIVTIGYVTQRRGAIGVPRDLMQAGAVWPEGPAAEGLAEPVRDAVAFAAGLSSRLGTALEGRAVAAVAREADVARTTIYDLRSGATWPDIVTVFKLEGALGVLLWVRPGS